MKHDNGQSVPTRGDKGLALFIWNIERWMTGSQGLVYTGHRMKQTTDGWLLVINGQDQAGRDVVAFVWADSPNDAWGITEELVRHGKLDWRADKYRKV